MNTARPLVLLVGLCGCPTDDSGPPPSGAVGADGTGSGGTGRMEGTLVAEWTARPGAQPFRPDDHGFQFQNYGAGGEPIDPFEVFRACNNDNKICTTAYTRQLIYTDSKGRQYASYDPTCVTTPQADAWVKQLDALSQIGHCEGMAVVSQMLYTGAIQWSDILPSSVSLYDVDSGNNFILQREINRWHVTQFVPSVQSGGVRLNPTDALASLVANWGEEGDQLGLSLALYWEETLSDGTRGYAGHAMTPYAVTEITPQARFRIYVYDNNYPGDLGRYIDVDTVANRSVYNVASNPALASGAAIADGTCTPNTYEQCLILTPDSVRAPLDCSVPLGAAPGRGNGALFATAADVELAADDGSWVSLRESASTLAQAIAGLGVAPLTGFLPGSLPYPTLQVPVGRDLAVRLTGTAGSAAGSTSIQLTPADVAVGIRDAELGLGDVAELVMQASQLALRFQSSGVSSPIVYINEREDTADYLFEVRGEGGAGLGVDASVDPGTGRFEAIARDAAGPAELHLQVLRNNAAGLTDFAVTVPLASLPARVSARYGEASATILMLDIDSDNDGDFDSVVEVNPGQP